MKSPMFLHLVVALLLTACGSSVDLGELKSGKLTLSSHANSTSTDLGEIPATRLPAWRACVNSASSIDLDEAYKSRFEEGIYYAELIDDAGFTTVEVLNSGDISVHGKLMRAECAGDLLKGVMPHVSRE